MTSPHIATGVVHQVPNDVKLFLIDSPTVLTLWNALTPLARNEWICWVTSVKKPETRADHIRRIGIHLPEGQKRPCCWPGCPHR